MKWPRISSHKILSADLAVFDSIFPQKTPYAFRNSEINEYINRVQKFMSVAMSPVKSDKTCNYDYLLGCSKEVFEENKRSYLAFYPNNRDNICYQGDYERFDIGLAYSFFVAETYLLVPFYEMNKIPFVFVLYPGGLFGLNSDQSDNMLKRIFASPQFKGVITTQQITTNYLVSNNLCPNDKITYIYGGFVQFNTKQVLSRRYYGYQKKSLDICFVGAKYSPKGIDKGFDVFIDIAKTLSQKYKFIKFHVVGGFDEREIRLGNINGKIEFLGYLTPDKLLTFYRSMDILISPNRPFKLYEGNFDGFPIGIDASYCGVALFVADELKMNTHYKEDTDLVIIKTDKANAISKLEPYIENPSKLKQLAINGQERTQQLFDINEQIDARLEVFKKYTDIKLKKESLV